MPCDPRRPGIGGHRGDFWRPGGRSTPTFRLAAHAGADAVPCQAVRPQGTQIDRRGSPAPALTKGHSPPVSPDAHEVKHPDQPTAEHRGPRLWRSSFWPSCTATPIGWSGSTTTCRAGTTTRTCPQLSDDEYRAAREARGVQLDAAARRHARPGPLRRQLPRGSAAASSTAQSAAVTPEWRHWQQSRLDARQVAVYRGALTYGHAFTLTEKTRRACGPRACPR